MIFHKQCSHNFCWISLSNMGCRECPTCWWLFFWAKLTWPLYVVEQELDNEHWAFMSMLVLTLIIESEKFGRDARGRNKMVIMMKNTTKIFNLGSILIPQWYWLTPEVDWVLQKNDLRPCGHTHHDSPSIFRFALDKYSIWKRMERTCCPSESFMHCLFRCGQKLLHLNHCEGVCAHGFTVPHLFFLLNKIRQDQVVCDSRWNSSTKHQIYTTWLTKEWKPLHIPASDRVNTDHVLRGAFSSFIPHDIG